MSADRLTAAEREKIEQTIRWHMNCDAGSGSYVGLCVENTLNRVEAIIATREAALREQIALAIEAQIIPADRRPAPGRHVARTETLAHNAGCTKAARIARSGAARPVISNSCPECNQGKHINCTREVLASDDSMQPCPCSAGAHQ